MADWSPDGRRIAFIRIEGGIYVVNADGSGVTQLTDTDDSWPAWSSDGQCIAFASGHGDEVDIYVMNADGSSAARLGPSFQSWGPAWTSVWMPVP